MQAAHLRATFPRTLMFCSFEVLQALSRTVIQAQGCLEDASSVPCIQCQSYVEETVSVFLALFCLPQPK